MNRPRLQRRAVLGVAALAGLAGAGLSWWRWQELQQAERATGEAVTLFYQQILPDSEGRVFKFDQLRNHQVVVNFWATWCAPCIEEMPELSALATELQSSGTRFLGVGIDNQDAIARFSRRVPVSYPLVVANATGAFLAAKFGNVAGGLPYTVVIDPAGRVKTNILGRVNVDSLRKVLKS